MLAPENRQTLLDALRPPPGTRLGCAVGTTFTLNLDAALTPPAAFALHAAVDAGTEPGDVEPLELLESIRRNADRFTVFHQAGQASVPTYRRLFAYLERSLVAVAPPEGIFHPKVWVLRFDRDGPPSFRALCATRNLSLDRSWDTILRLDGELGDGGDPAIEPDGLVRFLRGLPGLAVGEMDPSRRAMVEELADQVAEVRWEPPPGVEAGRFLPFGFEETPLPFPGLVDRLAVISPFLGSALLWQLPRPSGRRVLVSRGDEIDANARAVSSVFDEVFTLDPDAALSSEESPEGVPPDDPSVLLDGLHAKLYVFDRGERTTVLTGSANATNAAFRSSVELLTELEGPRSALGVEALLAESDADAGNEIQTLSDFLVAYDVDPDQEAGEVDEYKDELDELRRRLAGVRLVARAVEGEGDTFSLRFSSTADLPELPDGASWRVWPMSLNDSAAAAVPGGGPLGVGFAVSFDAITPFLANELTLGDAQTTFLLSADLVEAPANRDSRLLRALLGDAERFVRYLLMLLADDTVDVTDALELLEDLDESSGRWAAAAEHLPLLEAMLRTLSTEPHRLEQIRKLIDDLRSDPDGHELLPPGLVEIWEPIWHAARERT